MGQKDFRPELFTEPSEYEETPFRDRKQKLPNFRQRDEIAEFLRDVIALANTARKWGKPAYLLFGLDDRGNIQGIEQDLSLYWQPGPVPLDERGITNVMEKVRHQMGAIIKQYIAPRLFCELDWGQLEGHLLAYLLIPPPCSQEAFRVAQNFPPKGNPLLSEGDCWIRSGESKTKVNWQEINPHIQVPYIPPSGWLRYFEVLRSSEEVDRAAQKTPYIDLYDHAGSLIADVVRKWLEEDRRQILVLEGLPGSGKSTFLCRLVAEWADAGIEAMRETIRREEFQQPPGWIPVYFRLRELVEPFHQELGKEISRQVNSKGKLWGTEPPEPERLLESTELHWLVCFDGLDELWEEQKIEAFLRAVRSLCRRYPVLKVLISTRPLTTIPDDIRRAQIGALSEGQILTYLHAVVTPDSEPIYQQVVNGLQNPGSELYALREICTTPLYLEALASLISSEVSLGEFSSPPLPSENARSIREEPSIGDGDGFEVMDHLPSIGVEEIQFTEEVQATEAPSHKPEPVQPPEKSFPPLTIGQALDRMIQRVWNREASRSSITHKNLNDWWRATGKLALFMDGRRKFVENEEAEKFYSPKEGLQYVLNLSILRTSKSGIGFFHFLLQCYFGASYLQSSTGFQRICWRIRCKWDFWRSVMTILNQIQYSGGAL